MASNQWEVVDINTKDGITRGIAPVIVSASRSTDIPAFYSEWFMNRLREGYVKWVSPYSARPQYISFDKARVIVFWTKDAAPIIPHLNKIDEKGLHYYFTFTVNDYEKEGFEPGTRSLRDRIDTFRRLSEKIGKDKVIWRFDPLIMTDKMHAEALLDKVFNVGEQIADHTQKLVISFADISSYRKVRNNLQRQHIHYREFTPEAMEEVAKGLCEMNRSWGLEIATCCEEIDLNKYGIKKNKCVDDALMAGLFPQDRELMDFLGYEYISDAGKPILKSGNGDKRRRLRIQKDPGQRRCCGCAASKDIGRYDTCNHQCVYCYANSSPVIAGNHYRRYLESDRNGESILEFQDTEAKDFR